VRRMSQECRRLYCWTKGDRLLVEIGAWAWEAAILLGFLGGLALCLVFWTLAPGDESLSGGLAFSALSILSLVAAAVSVGIITFAYFRNVVGWRRLAPIGVVAGICLSIVIFGVTGVISGLNAPPEDFYEALAEVDRLRESGVDVASVTAMARTYEYVSQAIAIGCFTLAILLFHWMMADLLRGVGRRAGAVVLWIAALGWVAMGGEGIWLARDDGAIMPFVDPAVQAFGGALAVAAIAGGVGALVLIRAVRAIRREPAARPPQALPVSAPRRDQ